MAVDHRLHQLEERVERLEERYRLLLRGILRVFGEDIEEEAEGLNQSPDQKVKQDE